MKRTRSWWPLMLALGLPGLSSCGPAPKENRMIEATASVDVAYAEKSELIEGQALNIVVQMLVPDSSWMTKEPQSRVEGKTITITPIMERRAGDSRTAIAGMRTVKKRITGLKAGEYTVVVVDKQGNKQFPIVVKPKPAS